MLQNRRPLSVRLLLLSLRGRPLLLLLRLLRERRRRVAAPRIGWLSRRLCLRIRHPREVRRDRAGRAPVAVRVVRDHRHRSPQKLRRRTPRVVARPRISHVHRVGLRRLLQLLLLLLARRSLDCCCCCCGLLLLLLLPRLGQRESIHIRHCRILRLLLLLLLLLSRLSRLLCRHTGRHNSLVSEDACGPDAGRGG